MDHAISADQIENKSETVNEMPSEGARAMDRIRIDSDASNRLNEWLQQISERLRGVKINRSDLVSFLIISHDVQLSDIEMKNLETRFFDEVKFAQWAVQELKIAKAQGGSVTLADIIAKHQAFVAVSSIRARKRKVKNESKENNQNTS